MLGRFLVAPVSDPDGDPVTLDRKALTQAATMDPNPKSLPPINTATEATS